MAPDDDDDDASLKKLPVTMQIHVKFPLFRDATTTSTRTRIFLFFAGVDILNLDTHVRSIMNRYSLTDLQWISRLKIKKA